MAWRASIDYVMLCLCRLGEVSADVLLVCELLTMLLLDTYYLGLRIALDRSFIPVNIKLLANNDDLPTYNLLAEISISITNTLRNTANMQVLSTKLITLIRAVNNRTS